MTWLINALLVINEAALSFSLWDSRELLLLICENSFSGKNTDWKVIDVVYMVGKGRRKFKTNSREKEWN